MKKPTRLQAGDRVAAVSLSWGAAAAFPHRYQAGKRQLQEAFEVEVVETTHALREPEWLAANPQARAEDLMEAFGDPGIRAVISIIGGDDSIRILPYLDLKVLAENPKIFMGYSDTTVTHFACLAAGLVSFYGPAIMAGFAENAGIFGYTEDAVRRVLCSAEPPGELAPNRGGWTVEFLDWGRPELQARPRRLIANTGPRILQGSGRARGPLIGGCLEVMDWLRGTAVWPELSRWEGALLFLETSEEAPPPVYLTRVLRALAASGVLERIAGILFGRPGGQIEESRHAAYDGAILGVVRDELGMTDLPIMTNIDFGHTDPIMVLPYGVQAELNCESAGFSLLEAAVEDR